MFTLRKYQQQVIADAYNHIRQGKKRILIFAPTGAGKTIIATKIVRDAISRHKKVLFVVHREILVNQTFTKFSAVGLKCGFFKAGWPEDINARIQIASVQTLPKRTEWKQLSFDLIIFDECHLVAFSSICSQMRTEIFPDAIYLGLTATPWRLSKRESLGDIFSALVCAPMPNELIKSGFLVKPSYYNLNFDIQLDDLDLVDGDYNLNQLSATCDRPELIEQIITSWYDMAYSRPTIAFAVSVSHAENIEKAFINHGVTAAAVTGNTPISQRNELYQKLEAGELMVLASCAALSEGFDVPKVSCIILARPTKSKALYFQQLGRGLRLASNKFDCLVLDQSQNVLEHGFIEDLSEITLVPSDQTISKNKVQAPVKVCPGDTGGCGAYVYSFYLKCPHCQYDFDLQKLITVLGNSRLISHQDETKLNFYRFKLREAFKNNFAPSWAAMKFQAEYGFFPPFDWARGAIFNHQTTEVTVYTDYLEKTAQRLNKDRGWIEKYLYLEFGSTEKVI
ncbi:MAG: DEAD/DEAH box helicase [Waterburya sp.]